MSWKYEVQFRRHPLSVGDYTPAGFANNLLNAMLLRRVSGDLVVDVQTQRIVTDPVWLWPWEKKYRRSYAALAIKAQQKEDRRTAVK